MLQQYNSENDYLSRYPLKIPEIKVEPDLDFVLVQLPPRYMPLMPNGLGYVDLVLRRHGLKVQTLDLNIMMYHHYHAKRLLKDDGKSPLLPSGRPLAVDPWTSTGADEFSDPEVIDFFWPLCDDLLNQIRSMKPKAVGLTVDSTNRAMCNRFVEILRERAPETCVVVGGYLFLRDLGSDPSFKDFDYKVISEAELSLPPLALALARGERPRDLPGIASRYDSPDRGLVQPVLMQDVTDVGFPTYDWIDLALYHSYTGHFVVPISSSRGCSWSRCRFCSECFQYRSRSPESVADEVAYFFEKGIKYFSFNESILGGDPENLFNICTEFIKRGLNQAFFTGQAHVDKRHTVEYLRYMKTAGFHRIRVGVDGWSDNILRRQRKGYNMRLVKQTMKNCHEVGIAVDVNVLIGVPGETDEDITETIQNLYDVRGWINSVGSFNTLNLVRGSEYYENPELYGIEFRGDKDEIYAKHKNHIPDDLWYSTDPYIDAEVRLDRIERVAAALDDMGLKAGDFSQKVLKKKRATVAETMSQAARAPAEAPRPLSAALG